MNDAQLKNFIIIADCGSLGKAELQTFVSKQALKKQIDTLEEELGFSLFQRSSKGLRLTSAGEIFYKSSRKALRILNDSINECNDLLLRHQTLRIENPMHPNILLQDAINAFSTKYPDVSLQVTLSPSQHKLQHLLDGTVDIAERIIDEELKPEGISCTKVITLSYNCVMTPHHPLAKKEEILPEDLAGYTLGISHIESESELCELIKEKSHDNTITECRNGNIQDIYNICYNQGIYLSKAHFSRTMQPLVSIPLSTNLSRDCGIYYRTNHSKSVDAFIAIIKELYPDG